MSRTSPSSDFSLIKNTTAGIIYWDDGHSVSGESIEAAIDKGMKHFVDFTDEDNEHFIICSPKPLTDLAVKNAYKAWEKECAESSVKDTAITSDYKPKYKWTKGEDDSEDYFQNETDFNSDEWYGELNDAGSDGGEWVLYIQGPGVDYEKALGWDLSYSKAVKFAEEQYAKLSKQKPKGKK